MNPLLKNEFGYVKISDPFYTLGINPVKLNDIIFFILSEKQNVANF